MPITALPKSTIHLLGSTQTLTNAHYLVKELVDNALDAKATAVDVLISKDTLEKIEVRDNGHGISQDDFDALGRRGHTSKLRTFDELRSIGGMSLGFRGEALASAVQLGDVTLTTKTDGEAVATYITLKYPGGVTKQTKASHPVGTTVSVKSFLSGIPVRRQTALKAAPKTLLQIKELLQAYALARPNVRFALRVVKESKGSWSYVPRKVEGIKGAAIQIVGREVVAECVERTLSFASSEAPRRDAPDTCEDSGDERSAGKGLFIIEMLLPKPAPDATKISCGQFLSVDGRPVANDKGTMRKIVVLFKSGIKASCGTNSEPIKNPFIRLNIVCPEGSYDANVEPAKDDVLFSCENLILNSIEDFFTELYGKVSTIKTIQKAVSSGDSFELLLARKPLDTHPVFEKPGNQVLSGTVTRSTSQDVIATEEDQSTDMETRNESTASRNKWGIDMSRDLSEVAEVIQLSQKPLRRRLSDNIGTAGEAGEEEVTQLSSDLNPWSIARLTAPPRCSLGTTSELPILSTTDNQLPGTLPTPMHSSDPATQETYRHTPISKAIQQRRLIASVDQAEPRLRPQFDSPSNENQDSAINHQQAAGLSTNQNQSSYDELSDRTTVALHTPRRDFVSARHVKEADIVAPTIPESIKLPKIIKSTLSKPFISPLHHIQTPISRDNLRQSTLDGGKQLAKPSETTNADVEQEDQATDLAWAMDFEHRKEELIRQQKKQRKATHQRVVSQDEEVLDERIRARPSPHRNRYIAATAMLDAHSDLPHVLQEPHLAIPDGDPRSYLIRRQKSFAAQPHKQIRLKSNRLPLEKIPEGSQLHSLALNIQATIAIVGGLASRVGEQDSYITNGSLAKGLPLSGVDVEVVAEKMETLATTWKQRSTNIQVEHEDTLLDATTV